MDEYKYNEVSKIEEDQGDIFWWSVHACLNN